METPERQINVPLLRKTLEHIEAHPEEWHQEFWRCQSGMCFAGTTADLLGAEWTHPADVEPAYSAMAVTWNGQESDCQSVAQDELGLTYEQATHLFDASNTLDDLRMHVAAFCGEPIPVPSVLDGAP